MTRVSFHTLLILGFSLVLLGMGSTSHADGDKSWEAIVQMYDGYRKDYPDVPDISVKKFREIRKKDPSSVVLVDVREEREMKVSIIPGAISQKAFEAGQEKYKSKIVVAYCTIGYRAGLFAKELRAKGIDARNLYGSALAWAHEKLDYENSGKPTKKLHVYGEEWNLLPPSYEGIW